MERMGPRGEGRDQEEEGRDHEEGWRGWNQQRMIGIFDK